MNLPADPNEWSFELIRQLVDQGYLETDYYDFKGQLSGSGPEPNQRLTKTACAFANTQGGFIVFGIGDTERKNRPRIQGISNKDLGNEFGHKIQAANPIIHFIFGNPPIKIPDSSNVIFVVYIPKSTDRPHMFAGQFYYRTNEGNRLMDYQHVKEAFLQNEERRFKMKHLFVELLQIQGGAEAIMAPRNDEAEYPVLTMDTTVLNSLLVDTYSIIQDDANFVINLLKIRQTCSTINSMIEEFRFLFPIPMSAKNRKQSVVQHNNDLRRKATAIIQWTESCIKTLETTYALKNPLKP